MALETGRDSIFGARTQVEGTTPDNHDINWTEALTQDITNALAIDTYTLNHSSESGSIFNIYDTSLTTFLQWADASGATSILILDLGIDTFVHSLIMNFILDSATTEDTTILTEYSSDKTNWTTIDTDTRNGSPKSYDHFLTATKLRYLRITGTTNAGSGAAVKINRLRLIR